MLEYYNFIKDFCLCVVEFLSADIKHNKTLTGIVRTKTKEKTLNTMNVEVKKIVGMGWYSLTWISKDQIKFEQK